MSVCPRRYRVDQVVTVEHVEDLRSHLHTGRAENHLLDQREIERDGTWTIKNVAASVAESSSRWIRKGRRVEPLFSCP